jgi:hypothetical protein
MFAFKALIATGTLSRRRKKQSMTLSLHTPTDHFAMFIAIFSGEDFSEVTLTQKLPDGQLFFTNNHHFLVHQWID